MTGYHEKHKVPTKIGLLPISLILVSGTLMIAHGLRMIVQGVFFPTMTYQPNVFDLFFDWLTLCILGVFLFCFAAYRFYFSTKYLRYKDRRFSTISTK